ncbi:Autoinducer 2 sensor kinase/phosphatase LuxQ [Pirellula sp. SH-Sr6A]|nr:Autoinducer 2 sensor kinase/phosphatase LuxQ [Pirellula sp. SH-Sr6A]
MGATIIRGVLQRARWAERFLFHPSIPYIPLSLLSLTLIATLYSYHYFSVLEEQETHSDVADSISRVAHALENQSLQMERLSIGLAYCSSLIDFTNKQYFLEAVETFQEENLLPQETCLLVIDFEGRIVNRLDLGLQELELKGLAHEIHFAMKKEDSQRFNPVPEAILGLPQELVGGPNKNDFWVASCNRIKSNLTTDPYTLALITKASNFLKTNSIPEQSDHRVQISAKLVRDGNIPNKFVFNPTLGNSESPSTAHILASSVWIGNMEWTVKGGVPENNVGFAAFRPGILAACVLVAGLLLTSMITRTIGACTSRMYNIQRRLDIAAHEVSEGLWYWDARSHELWFNPRFSTLLAVRPPRELSHLTEFFVELAIDEDKPKLKALFADLLADGYQKEFSFRIAISTGISVWRKIRLAYHRDKKNQISYIAGSIQDVHGQRITEELLAQSEHRWKSAVEGNGDGLWDWDIVSGSVIFSNLWKEMIGYTPHEIENDFSQWLSLIHQDDVPSTFEKLNKHLRSETEHYETQFRLRCKDGTWKWILARGMVVSRNEYGEALRMIGTHTDISTRKEIEVRTQQLASIVNCSGDAIIRESLDGIIETWNHGAELLFGYPANRAIGNPLKMLYREQDEGVYQKSHDSVWKGEVFRVLDASLVAEDRSERAVSIVASPIFDPHGRVIAASYIYHDISDFKVSAEQLKIARELAEQANRSKSEFLANMSHEIRTPMTAIIGYSSLMKDSLAPHDLPREFEDYIDTIQRNSKHLLSLINDILDLSKIEAGKLDIEIAAFSLRILLADVIGSMQSKAMEKGIRLVLDTPEPFPLTVVTDPTRLRQILINLIGNAIKFTHEGIVQVRCEYELSRSTLSVRIRDTGIGMSESQMQRLFQPFQQADSTTSRKFGGTGLGLSISKRLASMLKGDIRVESVLGEGSVFTLEVQCNATFKSVGSVGSTLPVEQEKPLNSVHSVVANPTDQRRKRLDGLRILLVEDGPDNQRLITYFLQRDGAVVTLANDGLEAFEKITTSIATDPLSIAFDVIITDIQMPNMDGIELTKRVRSLDIDIPIIALTANAMKGDSDFCLANGCSCYLPKPIDRESLISSCESFAVPPLDRSLVSIQSVQTLG